MIYLILGSIGFLTAGFVGGYLFGKWKFWSDPATITLPEGGTLTGCSIFNAGLIVKGKGNSVINCEIIGGRSPHKMAAITILR